MSTPVEPQAQLSPTVILGSALEAASQAAFNAFNALDTILNSRGPGGDNAQTSIEQSQIGALSTRLGAMNKKLEVAQEIASTTADPSGQPTSIPLNDIKRVGDQAKTRTRESSENSSFDTEQLKNLLLDSYTIYRELNSLRAMNERFKGGSPQEIEQHLEYVRTEISNLSYDKELVEQIVNASTQTPTQSFEGEAAQPQTIQPSGNPGRQDPPGSPESSAAVREAELRFFQNREAELRYFQRQVRETIQLIADVRSGHKISQGNDLWQHIHEVAHTLLISEGGVDSAPMATIPARKAAEEFADGDPNNPMLASFQSDLENLNTYLEVAISQPPKTPQVLWDELKDLVETSKATETLDAFKDEAYKSTSPVADAGQITEQFGPVTRERQALPPDPEDGYDLHGRATDPLEAGHNGFQSQPWPPHQGHLDLNVHFAGSAHPPPPVEPYPSPVFPDDPGEIDNVLDELGVRRPRGVPTPEESPYEPVAYLGASGVEGGILRWIHASPARQKAAGAAAVVAAGGLAVASGLIVAPVALAAASTIAIAAPQIADAYNKKRLQLTDAYNKNRLQRSKDKLESAATRAEKRFESGSEAKKKAEARYNAAVKKTNELESSLADALAKQEAEAQRSFQLRQMLDSGLVPPERQAEAQKECNRAFRNARRYERRARMIDTVLPTAKKTTAVLRGHAESAGNTRLRWADHALKQAEKQEEKVMRRKAKLVGEETSSRRAENTKTRVEALRKKFDQLHPGYNLDDPSHRAPRRGADPHQPPGPTSAATAPQRPVRIVRPTNPPQKTHPTPPL